MSDQYTLDGIVVRGPARAPCVQLPDGTVCVPTGILYEKRTGKEIGNNDQDYRAFQKGYFGESVEFRLKDKLRATFNSDLRNVRNNFVKHYNMGLRARRDLERRIGRHVRI